MINQHMSPLFRIPRELRDEIYAYYAHEDDGLLYNYASRSLRFVNGRELDLSVTCKAIAEEMRGVSLQVNTVTFVPGCEETQGLVPHQAPPRACRFEHLLFATRWTKLVMLHYAAECVTETDLEMVIKAYPAISNVFRSCFRAIRSGFDCRMMSWHSQIPRDVFTTSFCDAVQYTLDLIANHPKFEELISKACESPERYPWPQPPFMQGTHRQVLRWRPNAWLIPTDHELCRMESLLTTLQAPPRERAKTYQETNVYFSATAICIATLDRLTPRARKQLRSINLREDCRGVGNPEVHAEGLINYCKENRKLQFRMQASFSTMLAPSFWTKPASLVAQRATGTWANVHDYMRILVDWLMRTAALTKLGMPKNSFAAVLDAQSQEAAYLWQYISRAASTRAHMPEDILNEDERDGAEELILPAMYMALWRLPAGLTSVVEDIINDVSIIRLETPARERLQQKEPVKPYATWSFRDWYYVSKPINDDVMFPGDADAYFQRYFKRLT